MYLQIEYTTRHSLLVDAGLPSCAEVVDDRATRYRGMDLIEAWTGSRYR